MPRWRAIDERVSDGGAGFIGSHLTRRLCENGHTVTVLDNLLTGLRENISPNVEFIELDLTAPGMEAQLPSGPFDAICHLAAQSSGALSSD